MLQCVPTIYLVQRMWAYTPNSGPMLGLRRSPFLVQCPSIVYDAGPALIQHWVCCILCSCTSANTWHSPNAVSLLTHSLRRWPNIETALGIVPCLLGRISMRVTLVTLLARTATTQITRYIDPMLMSCWATVCDDGPSLFQPKLF